MSIMGENTEEFQAPVCNSFKAKVFKGQLCYEVDPEEYRQLLNETETEKLGLSLLISFNADKQFINDQRNNKISVKKSKPAGPLTLEIELEDKNLLFIGTISKLSINPCMFMYFFTKLFQNPYHLS